MKRRIAVLICFVGFLCAVYWFTRQFWVLDDLVDREVRLRDALADSPGISFGVGLALYVIISLIPGTTGKSIVIGWLYGFWQALIMVNGGLTIAAMISFSVSRYVFADAIREKFGANWARFNRGLEREGAHYLFMARVLHAPYSLTNYVMGTTKIRAAHFWWATQLGLIPGNLIFVYAGAQLPTLQEMSDQGISALFSPGLLLALIAVTAFSLLMGSIVRRLSRASSKRANSPSEEK